MEDISREQLARGLQAEDLSVCACFLIGGASVNICLTGANKWTYLIV